MTKYRVAGQLLKRLGGDRVLAHLRRNGETRILSHNEAQYVSQCQTFRPLSEHAARLREAEGVEQPARSNNAAHIEDVLRDLAEGGFLVSESELRAILRTADEENDSMGTVPIQSLGIPTKNRPKLLKRALSSHAKNLKGHGRTEVDVVVLDDSSDGDAQARNRAIAEEIKTRYGLNVRYADRKRRAAYAKRLAEASGTDPDVARFALVGDPQYATHGGPRNAHLLDSVGRPCLQVDDDVLGGPRAVPDQQNGLALGSTGGGHQFWYFQEEQDAFDFVEPAEMDVLSVHEELLGRSVAGCAVSAMDREAPLSLDQLSSSLLQDIESAEVHVAVSIAGTAGDSAMPNHIDARLLKKGDSFRRLVDAGEDEYEANLTTRFMVRSPLQQRILSGGFLMSTIIGFDCRRTVPPFMVPGRNMDGTFGSLVHDVLNPYAVGYVPYVFRHAPPAPRPRADVSEVTGPMNLRLNDILITVLRTHRSSHLRLDVDEALKDVGRYLTDISVMNQADFNRFVREQVLDRIVSRIRSAERRLADENEPSYWAQHLHALIDNYQEHLTCERFFVPVDLQGEPSRRLATMKHLFETYGRLLLQWPAMVEGAQKLRAKGQRVSQPL